MLGFIKSVGNKAISSLPGFSSKTKITLPQDPHLQEKLKQISSQILKAQSNEQFKIYQHLQSPQNSDFNRNLSKIYQHQECTTQTINVIIKFYTFLLTNTKNQLVICKLVSEPLVIQLTKIVLQIDQRHFQQQDPVQENSLPEIKPSQAEKDSLQQPQANFQASLENSPKKSSTTQKASTSLHYLNEIDWDEVNAYKVALIRSYINCINPETIKYMIIDNELPIFVNCVNGYKHYLSEGVEGTCLSNCILMILTKVNHNDEVCEIIFDQEHCSKSLTDLNPDSGREKLSKSISNEKSMKLHIFVKQVIKKISIELSKVLEQLEKQLSACEQNFIEPSLKQFRKLEISMEFIESNILFCVDLINSINNYNYTTKIKTNIGEAIETDLIGKIVNYVQSFNEVKENEGITEKKDSETKKLTAYQQVVVKLIKFVLNLSITCQKESMMINFLNRHSPFILQNLIDLNFLIFTFPKENQSEPESIKKASSVQVYSKQCLTYMCDFALILLKQTISPYSKLASRKRLEISQQVLELKENILSRVFILLEQLTKSENLKEGVCYKTIRNLLLCVFFLTIKQDKCTLSSSSIESSEQKKSSQNLSQVSSASSTVNLGLILSFKYSILLLHKIFSEQFKKVFALNKHWEFIVNNYESLMREVPNSILSAQESDKHCHYHNGHNYAQEDKIRDTIMICEAVRNYRYFLCLFKRYMIIHETKLEDRLIRLENIYHKHFMSPGWNYSPGETIHFVGNEDFKVVCVGLLHNNSQQKLPMYFFLFICSEILQDFQCLLISHKLSENTYKLIANIRYKKIHSFIPENKNVIRMKLIGIQELILEFSSSKVVTTFKEYLNENRNKTRQKELKFINYYVNLYLKDSCRLIEEMYDQDLMGLESGDERMSGSGQKLEEGSDFKGKKLSFDNIEVEQFSMGNEQEFLQNKQQSVKSSPGKDKMKEENKQIKSSPIKEEVKHDTLIETQESIIDHPEESAN